MGYFNPSPAWTKFDHNINIVPCVDSTKLSNLTAYRVGKAMLDPTKYPTGYFNPFAIILYPFIMADLICIWT